MNKVFSILALTLALVAGQDEICPDGEEFWPYPDCTMYYVCNNGNPVIVECPDGTFWNQNEEYCDFPSNVPECVDGTRGTLPPTTPAPVTTPAPTTPEEVTEPEITTHAPETTTEAPEPTTTEGVETEGPISTTTTTTTTQAPETPETEGPATTPGPGQCPPTGVHKIAHPELCNAYYLCVNGDRIEPYMTCAEGLYFDPAIEECNLASEVDCEHDVTTSPPEETTTNLPPNQCPPTPGLVYIPYQGNCTLYILCIDEIPTFYRCPSGYLFDTESSTCKRESEAVCTVKLFDTIFEIKALEFDVKEDSFQVEKEYKNNVFQRMFQNLI